MIRVGFTGTRIGMTAQQSRQVARVLDHIKFSRSVQDDGDLEEIRGHHGCCEGADLEFGDLCRERGFPVEAHPGPDGVPLYVPFDVVHPPKGHLARNRDIAVLDVVVATPPTATPQPRGGTWYTIRYAREVGTPTLVVRPDGSMDLGGAMWPFPLPGVQADTS